MAFPEIAHMTLHMAFPEIAHMTLHMAFPEIAHMTGESHMTLSPWGCSNFRGEPYDTFPLGV